MTIAKAQLSEQAREALMKRARYAFPWEACGFIMNSADPDTEQFIFEVPNIAKNKEHRFLMDPSYQALVFTDEENIFGVWHSHPRGPDGPSDTDLKFMMPGIRCFVATANGVFEYEMATG